jgi:hypothetical protein
MSNENAFSGSETDLESNIETAFRRGGEIVCTSGAQRREALKPDTQTSRQ